MEEFPQPLDLRKLKVYPLSDRKSLTRVQDILLEPADEARGLAAEQMEHVERCAQAIVEARKRKSGVMLIYGAHLVRNGAGLILEQMMSRDWLTHLATNGAGTIHDWEYAATGKSTESVEENVKTGTFGTWAETGRNIHLALYAGGLRGEGYGRSLGRFIYEDGATFPARDLLEKLLRDEPGHELSGARADLLTAMHCGEIKAGRELVVHQFRNTSILGNAFRHGIPLTVHPGIGYDIISNHPMFNGAVIGRAAGIDFRMFASSVEALDGGVVLSIGSAIMGPQVFEKALSCVNNLRVQAGRPIVGGHSIYVVDLQDGGNWDWSKGEPPKTNPAYYLRFCKSFSRMGGTMHYVQCDNAAFVHNLFHRLENLGGRASSRTSGADE
jgi:hypothetical protein